MRALVIRAVAAVVPQNSASRGLIVRYYYNKNVTEKEGSCVRESAKTLEKCM